MENKGSVGALEANARDTRLDALKAIAIIAVFAYHLGFLPFGYLGVDIFLVINGYLVARSMLRTVENGRFSYIRFLTYRVVRLWPVVLIAAVACLILGYFVMLPDDYENLGDSVVASNFFATNILSRITVKNYWDVSNDYKPLMHTWYLGVIVQSYFVLGMVPAAAKRMNKDVRQSCCAIFLTLTAVSLILFFIPYFSDESKFYYLPFRLFEITAGAAIGSWTTWVPSQAGRAEKRARFGQAAVALLMLAMLVVPMPQIPSNIKLVLICAGTALLLIMGQYDADFRSGKVLNAFAFVGRYTLGIFILHQVVIAFFRYMVRAKFTAFDVVFIVCLTVFLTVLTSTLGKVYKKGHTKKNTGRLLLACIIPCMIITGCGLTLYMRGGCSRRS